MSEKTSSDIVIIGAGILGLAIAYQLNLENKGLSILIIEKESNVGFHASGRNSGVLHAGFYYTSDSMKARLTVAGNRSMRAFCSEHAIPIHQCGKLVVAANEAELTQLEELERRGKANGATVAMVSEQEALEIEPLVRTFQRALYSPLTATVDPRLVCQVLYKQLLSRGVQFRFDCRYLKHHRRQIITNKGSIEAAKVINCAGLYADTIAKDYGFGTTYTMLPFKGIYLVDAGNQMGLRTNIYPVPDLSMPFLGVHFTLMANGGVKIGPTAIPALWRENYSWRERFRFNEVASILKYELKLFVTNSGNFRKHTLEEVKKYRKSYLLHQASQLVSQMNGKAFTGYSKPGIRAQLLNTKTLTLVQDFVVEGDEESLHVLNAVSPAFTCAFPFADFLLEFAGLRASRLQDQVTSV